MTSQIFFPDMFEPFISLHPCISVCCSLLLYKGRRAHDSLMMIVHNIELHHIQYSCVFPRCTTMATVSPYYIKC